MHLSLVLSSGHYEDEPMRGAPQAPVNLQPQVFKGLNLPLHSWDRNQLKLLPFKRTLGIDPADHEGIELHRPPAGPIITSRKRMAFPRNHTEGIAFIRENDLTCRKSVDFKLENDLCFESDHRICILKCVFELKLDGGVL
jgi:hypothetical protein